jgi:peptide deformylase
MSILKIAKMGHPVLRQKAQEISKRELQLPQVQQLVDDMIETMEDYDGIGLAAPQVHVSKQLFVVQVPEMPRAPHIAPFPLTIVFNPKLTLETKDTLFIWEGCLSIPGLRGKVPRTQKISLTYLDRKGKEQRLEATGFLAGVVQHEFDHLQGKLFLERMISLESLTFLEEWSRYWTDSEDTRGEDEGQVKFL